MVILSYIFHGLVRSTLPPPQSTHMHYAVLCFDRPPVESPSPTTTIHGFLLLPVLLYQISTPAVNTHACVVVTLLYLYRVVYPPNYTAKPSSGCVHDHHIRWSHRQKKARLRPAPIPPGGYTLTLNSQLSTLNSHTHTHMLREYESSRVRTDGGTYILLLDYYYCSYRYIVLLHNNNNNNNNQPMQEKVLSLLQLVADLLIIIVREHRDMVTYSQYYYTTVVLRQ